MRHDTMPVPATPRAVCVGNSLLLLLQDGRRAVEDVTVPLCRILESLEFSHRIFELSAQNCAVGCCGHDLLVVKAHQDGEKSNWPLDLFHLPNGLRDGFLALLELSICHLDTCSFPRRLELHEVGLGLPLNHVHLVLEHARDEGGLSSQIMN